MRGDLKIDNEVCGTKGREKIFFRLHINRVVDWRIKLWSLWLETLATNGPYIKGTPDTIVV